jgi:8-oxo-dGTP pyrophosphatase MutT (NUDIX family)
MKEISVLIEWLRQRLGEPLPGLRAQELMMGRVIPLPRTVPDNARLSAVLCLLYPENDELHMLLMKRMEDRTAHSGQVSFPGGRFEAGDGDMQTTALREAHEEVGVHPAIVDVVGALTPLYIPVSNFNVFPYVGFVNHRPDLNLNRHEVSHVIAAPLSDLLHDGRKTVADVSSPIMPGLIRNVRAYRLDDGTIIWGATAMIISELETILKEFAGNGTS